MNGSLLHNAKPDDAGKRFSTSDPYQERRAYAVTSDKPVIDKEARTVELSFSSETPVERWFGSEVLVHSADAIDFSRLNNGHPLLCNHDPEEQIGVVVRAWLDESTRKARAVVKFSRSADGEEVFQDVQDGIRGLVSVGYRVNSWLTEDTNGDGEPEVYRAVKWTPYEISIVSVPADPNVGVGRSAEKTTNSMNKNTLFDAGAGATGVGGNGSSATNVIDLNAEREKIRSDEQKRVTEIRAIGKQCSNLLSTDDVLEAIATGKSVDEVRCLALERSGKLVKVENTSTDIGMSAKEAARFSVVTALRSLVTDGRLPDFEREASVAFAKKNRLELSSSRSFYIPSDVGTRALSAGTYASGGATVPSIVQSDMIELLRNAVVVANAGATMLSGLTGNVIFTRQNGGATAYWLSETGTVTESSQTFDQVPLTPKRLHVKTTIYKQLLAQSSIDVEAMVRRDIVNVHAIALDKAAIQGSGSAGEPLGLLNYAGINGTTAASATWPIILAFRRKIAEDNALGQRMTWLTSSSGATTLMGRVKETGQAIYLLGDDGKMAGYPVLETNSFATDRLILGDFSQMIVGNWGGLEIDVDNISGMGTDSISIYVKSYSDVAIRHIESFCADTSVIS